MEIMDTIAWGEYVIWSWADVDEETGHVFSSKSGEIEMFSEELAAAVHWAMETYREKRKGKKKRQYWRELIARLNKRGMIMSVCGDDPTQI